MRVIDRVTRQIIVLAHLFKWPESVCYKLQLAIGLTINICVFIIDIKKTFNRHRVFSGVKLHILDKCGTKQLCKTVSLKENSQEAQRNYMQTLLKLKEET